MSGCGPWRPIPHLDLMSAFGAKRKWAGPQSSLPWSKMTQGKNFELCYALRRFAVSSCAAGASTKAQRFQHDLTPQDYRSKTAVGSWRLSAWRELSLFAAFHIASDGNVIAKETEHFPSRVRPSRIGIGSGGTATGPSVAGSMDAPLL
jgi:hypothetical protein